jgi:polysaccharide biosynthesis protein PslH
MRILWLKTELLHPVDKGGKIRTYSILKGLRGLADVTYLCLDDGTAAPDAPRRATEEYCHRLITVPFDPAPKGSARFFADLAGNLLSRLPYAVARWRSRALEARLRDEASRVDLVVCDFLAPSVNVPPDLGVPAVLFQHNVEALIWQRHAEVTRSPLRRAYMREQWRRMRRFEGRECRRYDRVLAVSDTDRRLMEDAYGVTGVEVVPTGVDLDFFRPDPATARDPHRIVFTGSMDWMPNQDGVEFFLDQVFPRVRERLPDAALDIVGRSPPGWLADRAARDDAVRVTGFVDDIRPWIQRAAVAVVPLRVGGGTRLKIYEALAMETPVVSTTIGAEGLPLRDGDDILLADDPGRFADAVVRLLTDHEHARTLGVRAARRVRAEFGWDSVARRFEALCREASGEEPEPSRTARAVDGRGNDDFEQGGQS